MPSTSQQVPDDPADQAGEHQPSVTRIRGVDQTPWRLWHGGGQNAPTNLSTAAVLLLACGARYAAGNRGVAMAFPVLETRW